MGPHHPHPMMTVAMAAAELSVSDETIYNLIRSGRLRAGRITPGGAWRIRRIDFDAYIEAMFEPQEIVVEEPVLPRSMATPQHLRPRQPVPAPRTKDGRLDVAALGRAVSQQRMAR